jgi:murein L,D-transpeptidase YafK
LLIIRLTFLLASLGVLPALCAQESLSGIPQATVRIQAKAKSANVLFPLKSPEIRIYKRIHKLELWSSGKLVKAYKVGLGNKGLADKSGLDDHLTPEGTFYICMRNTYSKYHLFLGISYPNQSAAERGLKNGIISEAQHDQIIRSNQRFQCPPWNTHLGGAVGIHGHGSDSDWTWGCVALEDTDIDELWVACPIGTPVIIKP